MTFSSHLPPWIPSPASAWRGGIDPHRRDPAGLAAELRQTRGLLRRSESRYQALLDQTREMVFLVDRNGRVVEVNAAACAFAGYTRDQLLQLNITDTYLPEDRLKAQQRIDSLAPGERRSDDRQFLRKDGSVVTVEINLCRMGDGRIQGVLRDVTSPRQVEEHLRWLTLALEQSPAAVILTNTAGVIEYVNPGFCGMTGYSAAEVLGRSPRILKSGLNSGEEYEKLWATISAGRIWRGELCNRRKDGGLYWHSTSIAPIRDRSGKATHFLAVQADITDRVAAETALRERESRLNRLIDSNILGIGFWDASGVISEANDEYLRIVGYSREDLEAGRVHFRALSSPQYADVDQQALEQMARGEAVAPWEKELVRQDGRPVPVVVGVAPLNDHRDQGVAFVLDISERRTLEQQLRQAQKMEAVGRLAGGVAHDFNNILTAIMGYSDLLQMDMTPGHPGLVDAREIRQAADRAAGLTRQLLAFSRQQVLEPRVLDLNELVRNMEKMLRRLIGEDVTLLTTLGEGLGSVKADAGQLEQVLMNLVVNSRDALVEGGSLTITTANVEITPEFAAGHPGMTPGRQVSMAVRDTGAGMDQATKARLFEPFFTTKEKGRGTGLGLSTVYGIVKQSGGFVGVESELGQGTTMTVYLPWVPEAAEPAMLATEAAAAPRCVETVMVAEDDSGVRRVVREVLERSGYAVLEAVDGAEAARMAASHPGQIHLLLTDLIMPGMGGRDLATRLVADRPEIRVLYMSGYTDDSALRRGIIERGSAYLQKPFSPEVLLRKIRLVLEAAR